MKINLKSVRIRFFSTIVILLLAAVLYVLFTRFEGTEPEVNIEGMTHFIRKSQPLSLSVSDGNSGLRSISVLLEKEGKEIPLLDREFPSFFTLGKGRVRDENTDLTIEPVKLGLEDGKALLRISAEDYSWRNWWNGNKREIVRDIVIDTRPPRIAVLNRQHNIVQGGSGLVIYRLSEPCTRSGVRVGDNFFPGYSAENLPEIQDSSIFLCFIALNYLQGRGTPLQIEAEDPAGNSVSAGFYHYIRSRKFKDDIINISDGFLNEKMPEFEGLIRKTDASPLEKFLEVNRDIRKRNTSRFKNMGTQTANTLMWQGPFLRLPNSARRASFADHREYRYKGETIDRQVHMGVDLASLAYAPVPAANGGKVIFAEYIGIYGETVVIDHGFGLFSAYSHLSSMDVQVGQRLSKGDIIGKTGTTGMAGGDHLHLGMIVHNTFVNPVEWWDPAWIKNNVTSKIKEIKGKG